MLAPLAAAQRGELLHANERVQILRAQRADGTSLILKQPRGPDARKRLQHELGILERLVGLAGVAQLCPEADPTAQAIPLQDVQGATTLASKLREPLPELDVRLAIALRLSEILAAVHGRGLVHNDLNPANILVAGADWQPVLIDFELANSFAEVRPGFSHQSELLGTLAYLAPEQSGRTGRPVDQRADLYALGVTLYELFSGRRPFEGDDPLQLIHDHLTRAPAPLTTLDPSLPSIVSRIVLRLLEKEPDRRYQSAEGLAYDFARVRVALRDSAPAELGALVRADAVALGERDFPLRLSPPSRLIGRDAEIRALQVAFEQALAGAQRGALVSGPPGVGKSALIAELKPLVSARRGWLVAGKFDQYRQQTEAIQQMLRALGRLLLAEPESALAEQRESLLRTLGPNAGMLTALVPEFAILLGAQTSHAAADPVEADVRLRQAGLAVLCVVASPARPLVIVLDDLQWASPVALRVVEDLLLDKELRGVMLVGAHREGELDAAHPLPAMLSRWERLGAAPLKLRLANLAGPDLCELLAHMLRLAAPEAAQLAAAIGARTEGNPYETVELVNALRREGVLSLGPDGWRWDPLTIRRFVGQGDVLELLHARIARLPEPAQRLLESAACLGASVKLGMFAAATDLEPDALERQLLPALEDGVLVLEPGSERALCFPHDRVQQAAYARLDPGQRCALQLKLARQLGAHADFAAEAADQYLAALAGAAPSLDHAERRHVASLYRTAAERARLASNQPSAERFFAAALTVLEPIASAADERLLCELASGRHAALYSLGRLEDADQAYRAVEACCTDPVALARPTGLQINALTQRGRAREAVALAFKLLRTLGVTVPEDDLSAEVGRRVGELSHWGDPQAELRSQRPTATDPIVIARAELLDRAAAPAYFCDQAALIWILLEAQRTWVEHGPCAALVPALCNISSILASDPRAAYVAVRKGIALAEAHGYGSEAALARFLFATGVGTAGEPIEQCLVQARLAREDLLRAGDLQYASYTYSACLAALLECAPTIASAAHELDAAFAFAAQTGNEQSPILNAPFRQFLRALRGETQRPGSLSDASFDAAAYLTTLDPFNAGRLRLYAAIAALLFGDQQALSEHAAALFPPVAVLFACYFCSLVHLVHALALTRQLQAGEGAPAALLTEIEHSHTWLAQRAADAPDNFLHLALLVEAERAWALGDFRAALTAYDRARAEAAGRARPWHRALIAERAAHFHQTYGLTHSGRELMAEACEAYRAWGASAKVAELERVHAFLRAPGGAARREARSVSALSADAIDMQAVLRASQALSSETQLGRLKVRVSELLGALTGATTVLVALWREPAKAWFLATSAEQASWLSLRDAAARAMLPVSVFRYAERTREPLLIADALQDDRFMRDPYFDGLERCSVLALSILKKAEPHALLLLENRLTRDAFSAERLDTVTLLAGQLSISLENALLYEELEQRVADRTRELREAQAHLVRTARRAGMAEIATNVLHNVGNVLNSVNVSASMIQQKVRSSKGAGLAKAARLIEDHAADLGSFLTRDKRGQQLPAYLSKLAEALSGEQASLEQELEQLSKSIDHIKDIVATQQSYAGTSSVLETVQIRDLVEDALRLHASALQHGEVKVAKQFADVPQLALDRHRILEVLVNLISNAEHAMVGAPGPHELTISIQCLDSALEVRVADTGKGIAAENLTRIFAHGFSTRTGGHGFGLHSCVLAVHAMGGTLTAHSQGVGKGAVFTLTIPVATTQPVREA